MAAHVPQERSEELFAGIVENVDRPDLQNGLLINSDKSYMPFLVNPHALVMSEMAILSEWSEGRTIVSRDVGLRQTIAEFITRSATSKKTIDAMYRTITTDGGSRFTSVNTLLQGQLTEPCVISTANNKVTVTERVWHGGWNYIERSLEEGERGDQLLRAFIGSTIWAGHLAKTREELSSGIRQQADADSLRLLLDDKKQLRGPLQQSYSSF